MSIWIIDAINDKTKTKGWITMIGGKYNWILLDSVTEVPQPPHPKHTYLCGWNTLNPSFSYFIFRLGTKRHFMLTKRRHNFTFNSAMLHMIRRSWNSIIKIKFPGDKNKPRKITFQGTKYSFIDINTHLLASHKLQVLSFQKSTMKHEFQ